MPAANGRVLRRSAPHPTLSPLRGRGASGALRVHAIASSKTSLPRRGEGWVKANLADAQPNGDAPRRINLCKTNTSVALPRGLNSMCRRCLRDTHVPDRIARPSSRVPDPVYRARCHRRRHAGTSPTSTARRPRSRARRAIPAATRRRWCLKRRSPRSTASARRARRQRAGGRRRRRPKLADPNINPHASHLVAVDCRIATPGHTSGRRSLLPSVPPSPCRCPALGRQPVEPSWRRRHFWSSDPSLLAPTPSSPKRPRRSVRRRRHWRGEAGFIHGDHVAADKDARAWSSSKMHRSSAATPSSRRAA